MMGDSSPLTQRYVLVGSGVGVGVGLGIAVAVAVGSGVGVLGTSVGSAVGVGDGVRILGLPLPPASRWNRDPIPIDRGDCPSRLLPDLLRFPR